MKSRSKTSMQIFRYRLFYLVTLLLMLLLAGPGEAAVRASLDRYSVYEGDTLTLTIESDDRQSDMQPDLSPLEKNFYVLGTSTGTEMSFINGRRSDKTQWQVQLQPRHAGRLSIPPLSIGNEKTSPLEMQITTAPQQASTQSGQHVFVKAEVNLVSEQPYVQQQIPYTVRLYYDGKLQQGELAQPTLEHAVVEQLGEDKNYSTVSDGHSYSVVERHYVISPEKSGPLHIPPATFNGRVAAPQRSNRNHRSSNPMEDFFNNSSLLNDPFFHNSLLSGNIFNRAQIGKPITVRSQPIDMDVKPRPATAGPGWLPAEALSVSDSWTENPPQFRAGEPVSRTITVQTKGLSGSQIPELTIVAPANVRLYPEAPEQESRTDGTTIYGVRSQTLSYIPDAQGKLEVPAIDVTWWDTSHDKAAITVLPGLSFDVQAGSTNLVSQVQSAPESLDVQQKAGASPESEKAQTKVRPWLSRLFPESIRTNWFWILAGGSVLLALLVMMTIRRGKKRSGVIGPGTIKSASQSPNHNQQNQKSALQDLKKACSVNDRQAAEKALLNLGFALWPDVPPRSLDALAMRIDNGQAQLRELDRELYAAETEHWSGELLWEEFKHGLQEKKMPKHGQDDVLNPLYSH